MLDLKVILEIRRKAIQSMQKDSDDEIFTSLWKRIFFIVSFHIIPIGISLTVWIRDIRLSSIENYIGTGIAIFTGLFFSLLLTIGAKVRAERDNPDKDIENFQRFKTNMKQIANITLYVIITGIVVFSFMLLNSLFKNDSYVYIEKSFTVVSLFFLTRFIVSLFFMIQRFYFLVRDEINNVL